MIDDQRLLYERCARAVGHAVATFARANPAIESRAVVAALMTNLLSVASLIGDKQQLLTAVSQAWDADVEVHRVAARPLHATNPAPRGAVDGAESSAQRSSKPRGQPLTLLKPLR